jgi:hypothetical protein
MRRAMFSIMLIGFGGWSQPAKQQPRPPDKAESPDHQLFRYGNPESMYLI